MARYRDYYNRIGGYTTERSYDHISNWHARDYLTNQITERLETGTGSRAIRSWGNTRKTSNYASENPFSGTINQGVINNRKNSTKVKRQMERIRAMAQELGADDTRRAALLARAESAAKAYTDYAALGHVGG